MTLDDLAKAHRMPAEVLAPAFAKVRDDGYAELDGERLVLTPTGQAEIDRMSEAWRRWLDHQLDDWDVSDPADRARLDRAVESIASRLLEEEQARLERVPA